MALCNLCDQTFRYWDELSGLVGVRRVGTDYGQCCMIVPQIALR
jgi:hypothetical protein